jgi:hypothetical protein
MTAHGTAVFGEAVRMVGDALSIKLDEVRCDAEYAQTTEGVDLGSWTIPAGCVAGVYASLKGASSARRRSWRLPCASAWARPSVGLDDPAKWLRHRSSRPPDGNDERGLPSVLGLRATTLEEFKVLGHIMTATHRCTIAVAAAAIVTYNGVPLILPRGVAALT